MDYEQLELLIDVYNNITEFIKYLNENKFLNGFLIIFNYACAL